jgi:hypothetical protein
MRIFYGTTDKKIDVTILCCLKFKKQNIVTIPSGDGNRDFVFMCDITDFCLTDTLTDVERKVYIYHNNQCNEYDEFCTIEINLVNPDDITITTRTDI